MEEWNFHETPQISLAFNIENDNPKNHPGSEDKKDGSWIRLESLSVSDSFSDEPIVGKKELLAYYLYSSSTNGLGPVKFSLTLFQALITAASYDFRLGPGSVCQSLNTNSRCVIEFGAPGTIMNVNSVILIANGLSFGLMTIIYTTLGPLADHGKLDRGILLLLSVVCWASQFSFIAVTNPSQWRTAMALYMIGLTAYGGAQVFIAAALPRLARQTSKVVQSRADCKSGKIKLSEHEKTKSLEKSWISIIGSVYFNIGYIISLLLSLSILVPFSNVEFKNNFAVILCSAYSMLVGIWWFIFQKNRSKLPPSKKFLLVRGWSEIFEAFREWKKNSNTFKYLLSSIFLAASLNTTETLVYMIQSQHAKFSFLELTYFNLVQAFASIFSIGLIWYSQKRFNLKSKQVFLVSNFFLVLVTIWGLVGIFNKKFGFHKTWEFWVYNVVIGVSQTCFYAYSVALMSELTPPGYENMFFGLWGFSNRLGSFIGPTLIQVIINSFNSTWAGFPVLLFLSLLGFNLIFLFVNLDEGKKDALKWSYSKKSSSI